MKKKHDLKEIISYEYFEYSYLNKKSSLWSIFFDSFVVDLSQGVNLEPAKLDEEKNGARILISGMPPLIP